MESRSDFIITGSSNLLQEWSKGTVHFASPMSWEPLRPRVSSLVMPGELETFNLWIPATICLWFWLSYMQSSILIEESETQKVERQLELPLNFSTSIVYVWPNDLDREIPMKKSMQEITHPKIHNSENRGSLLSRDINWTIVKSKRIWGYRVVSLINMTFYSLSWEGGLNIIRAFSFLSELS